MEENVRDQNLSAQNSADTPTQPDTPQTDAAEAGSTPAANGIKKYLPYILIGAALLVAVIVLAVSVFGGGSSNNEDLTLFSKGKVAVSIDGKFGYADKSGKLVINPQFDEARRFNDNGLAAVCIGDKWGFINEKGTLVINPQFNEVI
ncbi:MAG: WG repeat-containing protein [Clostridiales bacterium]|nr:WG repeat-containing protein [Clostridiales bacterium]